MASDTVEAVENGLAAKAAVDLSVPEFESWDPINPSNDARHGSIKSDYRRVYGSSGGQAAISRAFDNGAWPKGCGATGTTTLKGKIEFAGSSVGPLIPGTAGSSQLTFIPFARDALSYAYSGSSTALGSLSTAQIQGIYKGTITSIGGVIVHPYLPPAGSGNRLILMRYILGVPDEPGFWATLPTASENDARFINVPGRLVPFSVANWIAEKNNKQINHTGTAALGKPNAVAPNSGTAPNLVPSASFYSSTTYGRDVYNVVTTQSITSGNAAFNPNLYKLFVNDGSGNSALRKWDTTTTSFGFSLTTKGVNGSTILKGDLVVNPFTLAAC